MKQLHFRDGCRRHFRTDGRLLQNEVWFILYFFFLNHGAARASYWDTHLCLGASRLLFYLGTVFGSKVRSYFTVCSRKTLKSSETTCLHFTVDPHVLFRCGFLVGSLNYKHVRTDSTDTFCHFDVEWLLFFLSNLLFIFLCLSLIPPCNLMTWI